MEEILPSPLHTLSPPLATAIRKMGQEDVAWSVGRQAELLIYEL